MGKFFPKLTQTTVFIQTDKDGGGFDCPMLPISCLAEIDRFSSDLQSAKSIEDINAIRVKMINLLKKVIPVEYHPNLQRIDIPTLTDLIAYVMYGDPENDDQRKSEKN